MKSNFVTEHLVEDDADDLDTFLLKQRLVQRDFIDGPADAALRDDDHLRAEDLRDLRVGQIENRTDAGMAGAFAEHEILFPSHAVEGLLDLFDQGSLLEDWRYFRVKSGSTAMGLMSTSGQLS